MLYGKVPPVIISQKLGEGIQCMGIGEAVVFDLSPDAFQRDVAKGHPGLIADELAELQKVLVCPIFAISPAGFFFEHFFYLPDEGFVSLHSYKSEMIVT